MKAILVIDMPQTCEECKLKYFDVGDDAYWGINVERCIFDNSEIEHKERAYDCPLRPMPERKEVYYTDPLFGEIENLTNIGYNKCLDDLGETE